jgi:hypothetical protein
MEPAVLIQKYEQGTGGFLRFPRIPKSGKTGTGGSLIPLPGLLPGLLPALVPAIGRSRDCFENRRRCNGGGGSSRDPHNLAFATLQRRLTDRVRYIDSLRISLVAERIRIADFIYFWSNVLQ